MKKGSATRWLAFLLLPVSITALPQGERVTSGEADFHLSEDSFSIKATDKAIISYDSFDVGKQEQVRFLQPSKNATVLNRVTGSNPSEILGRIHSNGKVFLVNPHGVYFGKEATVDTGSLVVSTLDILDQDFLEDRFSFRSKKGCLCGLIHNEGTLTASDGIVGLISPQIKNEGVIRAALNKVLLASSEAVTLTFTDDGLMSFEIEDPAKEGFIEHLGNIEANQVFLRLAQAKEMIQSVINLDGLIDGNRLIQENGKIRIAHQSSIHAASAFIEGAKVSVEGEIDVSINTPGTIGGTLHILGDHLELLGARIDASGDRGGGTVLIGGEYKGQGDIRKALTNHMDANSVIQANALTEGTGGRVILWADDSTRFNGTIFVKGGEISGDGGFVETSGNKRLGSLTGRVNALSPYGKAGTWLLDPLTITIVAGSAGTIGTGSGDVGDCADTTTNPYAIGIDTINSSTANVLLCASSTSGGAINQNSQAINITTSGIGIQFEGSNSSATPVTLNASITTNGGAVTFTNVDVDLSTDISIDTTNSGGSAGANVSFDTTSTIDGAQALTITAGTGTLTIEATIGGTTPPTNLAIESANLIQLGANITLTGDNPLTFPSPINLTASSVITSFASPNTGQDINFNSTIDGTQPLNVEGGTGTLSFNENVGSTTLLASLAATSSNISVGGITTTGAISLTGTINMYGTLMTSGATIAITGPINLSNNSTLNTTGGGMTAGGNVTLSAVPSNQQAFVITAGTGGVVTLGGNGGNKLEAFSITAGTINQNGNVGSANSELYGPVTYTASAINITNKNIVTRQGIVTITGPVVVTGNVSIDTTDGGAHNQGASIIFSGSTSTIDQGASAVSLLLQAGTLNPIIIEGAIGGITPLANLFFSEASQIQIGANITLSGANPFTTRGLPVRLIGASTITSNNANITFATINGSFPLNLVAGTGTIVLSGAIGGTTALSNLIFTSSSAIQVGANITVSGANPLTFPQAAELTGPSTITSNNANIGFSSTLDGAQTLVLNAGTGSISLGGAVGATTALTSLSATVTSTGTITQSSTVKTSTGNVTYSSGTGGITIANNLTTTSNGAISITGPVTLTVPVTLSTSTGGGANISFSGSSSTINGAEALTLAAGTGTVSLGGAIGAVTPLTNLTFTSATFIQIGANITVSGANSLTFPEAAELIGPSTITSNNANISFSSTLDGAEALIVAAGSGNISLGAAVGATTALTSFSAAVTSTGTITQSSTVETSTGNVTYSSAEPISIDGNITTTMNGAISITGPVTLGNAITMDTSGGGGNISFFGASSTIDGAQTLTLTAGTGSISLGGAVGATTALTSLSGTVTSTGTITQSSTVKTSTGNVTYSSAEPISIEGNITTTSNGAISITGPLTLTVPVTLSTSIGGGANISFSGASSTINGAEGLTLAAGTGTVSLGGAIGAVTPLTNLTFTSAAFIQIGANITVSGANPLTFPEAAELIGPSTITSNNANISFSSTLDGSQALIVAAGTGSISFGRAVGATTALTSLSATVAGVGTITQSSTVETSTGNVTYSSVEPISIDGTITTNGAISITGPVTLGTTITMDTSGGNGNISFSGASSTIDGAEGLTLAAGTGTVSLGGAIGGVTPLTNLAFTSAGFIQIGASITLTGANPLSFPDPVSLTGSSTITNTNNNISFSSTLDGAEALIVAAGNGSISFGGAVGATTALTSFSVTVAGVGTITQSSTVKTSTGNVTYSSAEPISIDGNITTTTNGAISITGPVTLGNAITMDTSPGGGGDISFSGASSTIDGAQTLTLTAGTGSISLGGAVGATTALTSLSASGSAITQSSTLSTFGAVTYTNTGLLTLGGILTVGPFTQSGGGTVLLEANINSTNTVHFGNAVNFNATLSLSAIGVSGLTFLSPLVPTVNSAFDLNLTVIGGGIVAPQLGSASRYINTLTLTAQTILIPPLLIYAHTIDEDFGSFIDADITSPGGNLLFSNPTTVAVGTFTIDITGGISTGGIAFSSTLNGPGGLTFDLGTGNLIFGGAVGEITALGNVTVANPNNVTLTDGFTGSSFVQQAGVGTTTIEGTMSTSGPSGVSLTGNIFDITGAINTTNGGPVTFDNSGLLTLSNTITSNGPVSQTGSGPVDLESTITTTNGSSSSASIGFAGAVLLTEPITLNTTAGNGTITFGVLSSIDGAEILTLEAGSGTVSLLGAVGGINPLTNLVFASAGLIEIGSDVTVTGAHPLIFPSPVRIAASSILTSNNADILFESTLDGGVDPTINAGTGTILFSGAVGSIIPLADLIAIGGILLQDSTVTSLGAVAYINSGLVTIAGMISGSSFSQSGGGNVLLEASINAGSFIHLTDPVSFNTSLSLIAGRVGGIIFESPIIPTSTRIYNLTLSAKNGPIIGPQLGSPTEYINRLVMKAKSIDVPLIYANILVEVIPIHPYFEYIPGIYTNYWKEKDTLSAPWYFDLGLITDETVTPWKGSIWAL